MSLTRKQTADAARLLAALLRHQCVLVLFGLRLADGFQKVGLEGDKRRGGLLGHCLVQRSGTAHQFIVQGKQILPPARR